MNGLLLRLASALASPHSRLLSGLNPQADSVADLRFLTSDELEKLLAPLGLKHLRKRNIHAAFESLRLLPPPMRPSDPSDGGAIDVGDAPVDLASPAGRALFKARLPSTEELPEVPDDNVSTTSTLVSKMHQLTAKVTTSRRQTLTVPCSNSPCQALLRFGVPDDGRARTMVLDCPRCGATLRIKMKPVQQKGMTHSASDHVLLKTAAALGGGDSLDDSVRRAMSSSKNLD